MNRIVWIADDEQEILDYYRKIFGSKGQYDFFDASPEAPEESFTLQLFHDGEELLAAFSRTTREGDSVPLCILDMRMKAMSGLETAEAIRRLDPLVNIIIVTAFSDYSAREIRRRLKENIYYIKKPFNVDELLSLTDSLVKNWNEHQQILTGKRRLDSVISSAADGIVTIRADGTIIDWNLSAEVMFGLSSDAVSGKPIFPFIATSSGVSLSFDEITVNRHDSGLLGVRQDGSRFPLEMTAGGYMSDSAPHYTLVIRDISRRRFLEEALRQSEQRWQYALEGPGDGLWDWDPITNKVFFSRQWKAMLGYDEHEIGNSLSEWDSRIHPDDRRHVYAETEKHLSGLSDVYSSEHRLLCKDGSYKWVLDRGKVISRTPDGKPQRVIGTHSDISARKLAEQALAKARRNEEELASQMQQRLLFGTPPSGLPGFRAAARSIPSQAIDGDFYDFYVHNDWCVDVLVGDVMGKGFTAALIGAGVKSAFLKALAFFRSTGREGRLPSPLALVNRVHTEIVPHLMDIDSFVSLVYARFDLNNARLDVVNCGHPHPILCRANETGCRELPYADNPMGFFETSDYQQVSYPIEPGDTFFFFSDGLTDCLVSHDTREAQRIIYDMLWKHRNDSPEDQIREICGILDAGKSGESFMDDITCLGVRTEFSTDRLPLTQSTAVFSNRLEEMEQMRAFVHRLCSAGSSPVLGEDDTAVLELAATEAMSNIIRHAYAGKDRAEIELKLEILPDRVSLTFAHTGREPVLRGEDLDRKKDGSGFGLFIISQGIDEILYSHDERGRNCVILVKKSSLGKQS